MQQITIQTDKKVKEDTTTPLLSKQDLFGLQAYGYTCPIKLSLNRPFFPKAVDILKEDFCCAFRIAVLGFVI